MKKKSIISLILSVGIFASFIPQSLAAQNLNWSINENEVLRRVEHEFYGVNWEWNAGEFEHEDSPIYTKNEQGEIVVRPDFTTAWADTLMYIRSAGASANEYLWKQSLGDFSERKPQQMWGYQNGIVYSALVDTLKVYLKVNPEGKLMYTLNMVKDTKENALDVVEFLIGDGTVNYNGGENWAQKRIELGLPDPIDIVAWELGNEVDFSYYTETEYVDWAKDMISAIRTIDPDAKFCMLASTSAHANEYGGIAEERKKILGRWENYHRYLLEQVGNDIDYLTFHYYYPLRFIRRADPVLDRLEQDVLEITGENRIKIAVTEHSAAPNSYNLNPDNPYDYYTPLTAEGTTAQMEFYLRMMYRPMVTHTNNHSVNGAGWCIMYVDENGKLVKSFTGEMLNLLNRFGVGELLKSDLDTFSKDQSSNVAGQVIRDKDGNLNILFTNRNETEPVNMTFKFANGNYKLKYVKRLHGPDKKAYNLYRHNQAPPTVPVSKPEYTEEAVNSNSAFFSYTFDPMSIYALQLEPTTAQVSEEEKALAEAKKYMAIGNGYETAYVNAKPVSVNAEYKGAKAYIAEDGAFLISSEMLKKIFGASLTWDDSGNVCTATIGSKNLVFNTADGTVKEAGMPAEGFVPARRVGDWTYFVLRNIATNLGYSVNWDNRGFVVMGQGGITPDAATCDTIYNAMIGG